MAKKKGGNAGQGYQMPNMAMLKQMMMAQFGQAQEQVPMGKPEKIKGTQIKMVKGGGMVRVVTSDGKEFPITATKAVYKHLKSIGEEVVRPNPNQQQGGKKGVMKKQKQKKERTPEELEAHKQKMQENNQKLIEKEGRVLVSDVYHSGEIISRGGFNFMWVKPDNPSQIPGDVAAALQTMNDEARAKHKNFLGGSTDNAVYVRFADISGDDIPIKQGTKVNFKLYKDNKGVGGCEVISA